MRDSLAYKGGGGIPGACSSAVVGFLVGLVSIVPSVPERSLMESWAIGLMIAIVLSILATLTSYVWRNNPEAPVEVRWFLISTASAASTTTLVVALAMCTSFIL